MSKVLDIKCLNWLKSTSQPHAIFQLKSILQILRSYEYKQAAVVTVPQHLGAEKIPDTQTAKSPGWQSIGLNYEIIQ